MSRPSHGSLARTALATALAVTAAATGTACSGGDPITTPRPTTPGPATPAAVATVTITPDGGSVRVGRTMSLAATARDAAGNALAGRTVTWRSSADSVARVDASGLVTAVAAGSATITAESEGRSAQATLTVTVPGVASVAIAPDTATLALGETRTLVATVRDDDGAVMTGRTVRWTSSAPAVAAVDSVTGVVRALTGGSAVVTATADGRSGSARLAVRVPVHSVTVTSALDTLEAYDVVPLAATLRDANGAVLGERVVRWTSSDPAVATVDSVTGRLTGVDRGTVTVTATSEGRSGTASRVVVIRYRSLATGSDHACDIASGGIVWCWGRNGAEGRLGSAQTGSDAFSAVPVRLSETLRFQQLSAYGSSTCGVTTAGEGYCWGTNVYGKLGNGSSTSSSPTPVRVATTAPLAQVSVGAYHACGVTTAGALLCWGNNGDGEFGTGTRTSSTTPVAAGVGAGGPPQYASVAAGTYYTCGIGGSGAGFCWGVSGLGELGDGTPPSLGNTHRTTPGPIAGGHAWSMLAASGQVTCGVTTAGAGYCWGRGNGNRLGNGSTSVTSTPSAIAGGLAWRGIDVGSTAACGVASDAGVWCWGLGGNGQLGQALPNGSTTPVRVGGGLRGAEVRVAHTAGGDGEFACAIGADRLTTYCWGRNTFGQLGNGTTTGHTAVNAAPSIVVGQRPLGGAGR